MVTDLYAIYYQIVQHFVVFVFKSLGYVMFIVVIYAPSGYSAVVFSVKSECILRVTDHPIIHVVPSLPLLRVRLLGPSCVKAPILDNVNNKHRNSIVSIIESNNMLEMMDGER